MWVGWVCRSAWASEPLGSGVKRSRAVWPVFQVIYGELASFPRYLFQRGTIQSSGSPLYGKMLGCHHILCPHRSAPALAENRRAMPVSGDLLDFFKAMGRLLLSQSRGKVWLSVLFSLPIPFTGLGDTFYNPSAITASGHTIAT